MNTLINAALGRSRTVLALLAMILIAGIVAFIDIPKEAEPDIPIPTIYVNLVYRGISPEDGERLLVRPMERELRSVEGVKEIKGQSFPNAANVTLEFEAGFDVDKALQDVREAVDVAKATAFVQRCQNFDGGYGAVPGAESHGGQIFCCVGALAIGHALDYIDRDLLAWWLCERQCDSGGLNGRPEKQADVCYSWWNLSCLSILGRVDWIDKDKLVSFILNCQDPTGGGIRYVGDVEGRGVSVWVWVWVSGCG